MSFFGTPGYAYSRARNLSTKEGALLFEDNVGTEPTGTTDPGKFVLYRYGDALKLWDGSSATTLGSAGSVANFSLNDAYDDGSTITVDGSTITLNANIAAAALTISQSGAGGDILGTSSTWSVSKAGAAVFTAIAMADNELITFGTGSDATIGWNATLLNIAGATDFDDAVTTQSTLTVGTTFVVTGGAGSDAITLTAGDVQISDGSLNVIDADTGNTVTVTNNTHTTGSATTGGVVEFRSTSVTTGALLNLELTEAALNGGQYLRAYDATGTEDVFTLNENGAISILGNASGTDSITVTAGDLTLTSGDATMTVGDLLLSDGSLNITDADSAVSFSVTNNTITTTAAMADFDSTSITTGALVRMNANTAAHDGEVLELISAGDTTSTPVGLSVTIASPTTGAARGIEVTMAAATTTAKGIAVTMDAITTGDMLYLDNGGASMTGDGKFINCNDDNVSAFSVSANGATVISGSAAGTAALTMTAGDLVVTDTDGSTIDSVDGTASVLIITAGGATGADSGALEVIGTAASNADSAVIRATQDSLTGASFVMNLKQDDLDVGFINFEGTATADANSPISTHGTTGAVTDFIRVAINGTKAWIAVSTNDPTA